MNDMYSDLFTLYQQNTENTGFWVRKKNWANHVAQVLQVYVPNKLSRLKSKEDNRVIAMIMNTNTNEIFDIVELAEPGVATFQKLEEEYKPNTILPQSLLDYLSKTS